MLETKCIGDKFEMLVTDSRCWWPIYYIEKITNITEKFANIMILPPTSEISHHHKVTNITVSPTSLSPPKSYPHLIELIDEWYCCREYSEGMVQVRAWALVQGKDFVREGFPCSIPCSSQTVWSSTRPVKNTGFTHVLVCFWLWLLWRRKKWL